VTIAITKIRSAILLILSKLTFVKISEARVNCEGLEGERSENVEESMSIVNYFKRKSVDGNLPEPRSILSRNIPSVTIAAANAKIRGLQEKSKARRGPYNNYTPEDRAVIGKFATENGVMAAKRRCTRQLNSEISESTVRCFKEFYLKERARKRQHEEDDVMLLNCQIKKGEESCYW
jgi:hypothetical protein